MARFESTANNNLDDGRWIIWKNALGLARNHWFAGTGLGSFQYAQIPFRQLPQKSWSEHTENHYLETLCDAGLPGLMLLGAAVCLSAMTVNRLLIHGRSTEDRGLGLAGNRRALECDFPLRR